MNASLEDPRPSVARKTVTFVALALFGGMVGAGIAHLTDGRLQSWEDEVAVLMAAILIGVGLMSAAIVAIRPASVPKGCGALQSIVMLLAGGMFLLPVFGTAVASPQVVLGLILALLVIQSVANLMLWRAADEMLRRIMSETSALAFWALQLALFVYAAAERLGFVETISGWGLMGVLMGVYLVASIVASARRGIT